MNPPTQIPTDWSVTTDWSPTDIKRYQKYYVKQSQRFRTQRRSTIDAGRNKVYAAEWNFTAWLRKENLEIRYDSLEQAHADLIDVVFASCFWKEQSLTAISSINSRITKNVSNPTFAGRANSRFLEINPNHIRRSLILHELSHSAGYLHHDVEFRLFHVAMVTEFVSERAGKQLHKCYRQQKLSMSRHKPPMSPEQWKARADRLAAARAAREQGKTKGPSKIAIAQKFFEEALAHYEDLSRYHYQRSAYVRGIRGRVRNRLIAEAGMTPAGARTYAYNVTRDL